MMSVLSFDFARLREAYRAGEYTSVDVANEALVRIAAYGDPAVWITRVAPDDVLARAHKLAAQGPSDALPLWGIPFAVKDNIDVAGVPTTAGCPAFAYTPQHHAFVVERLLAAGAILMGKTNLDQFATGLVGTRSPYGAPRCVFDSRYVSGGSSSGSAVAVAAGLVAFALGTDTAGSGRIPAIQQHRRIETDQRADWRQRRGTGVPESGLRIDFRQHHGRCRRCATRGARF